jgi:bifunctional polynucleotide phosphatase/kinase
MIELQPGLLFIGDDTITSDRIFVFDLDNTLIVPSSGKKFPINANDWKFKYSNVKQKLQILASQGVAIYIITNQAGISIGSNAKQDQIVTKIKAILHELDIPIRVFISTGKNVWRKPNTAIVERYILPNAETVSKLKQFVYVGDAAGRPDDFSDSDRKFAYNIYLWMRYLIPDIQPSQHAKFITDDAWFATDSEPKKLPAFTGFDPVRYMASLPSTANNHDLLEKLTGKRMIILIGPPGSGKSTLAQLLHKMIKDSVIVNQDVLKTKQNCIKTATAAIQAGKTVILDKTNPSDAARSQFAALVDADELLYCHMAVSRDLANHLNIVRNRIDPHAMPVPEISYAKYYKSFEKPNANVCRYDFIPEFKSKLHKLYFMQRS